MSGTYNLRLHGDRFHPEYQDRDILSNQEKARKLAADLPLPASPEEFGR